MKLCIFGGSFDPVHEGHVRVASRARECCGLDRVLFMPCSLSPLKEQAPSVSDARRCRMIELALKGLDWAVLDRTDLNLPPPSWSWRVAESVAACHPGAELFWLMGKDQWDSLEKWGRWRHLADMATFIVYHRGGAPASREGVRAVFIEGDEPASSTGIREALRAGVCRASFESGSGKFHQKGRAVRAFRVEWRKSNRREAVFYCSGLFFGTQSG